MFKQMRLFATVLSITACAASQANGQLMLGGGIAGPVLVPPRAGSFFFGAGPPILAPPLGLVGPFAPSFGFYMLAPAQVPPPSSDQLLMPLNADDLLRGTIPNDQPNVAVVPRERPDDAELPPPRLRVANEKALARARQFIEFGDASFRRQEFARAYDRYRKAAEAAPNLAEAYFRQALAQSAIGQFLPAVKTIRRGLAIDAEWSQAAFRLDQLYPNRAAKEAHLERLALTAGEEPNNAELMFLLGIELYFDAQPARAATFLQQAVKLGLDEKRLHGFLDSARRRGRRGPRGEEL
ncbi:MAG TPA: hypothetical protein VF278_15055 [Pirellulales bacterium]